MGLQPISSISAKVPLGNIASVEGTEAEMTYP